MEARPQRIISLSEYGMDGEVTIEPLDFVRRKRLENNIGKASRFEGDQIVAKDFGDIAIYNVMAHITSAPFKFESLDGFYKFMERMDKRELGSADRLFERMCAEVRAVESRENSPLEPSTDSVPSSTEPTD